MRNLSLTTFTITILLCGCAVGPNFHEPPPPHADHYTPTPQPEATAAAPGEGGAAQHFLSGSAVPDDWWELFQCEALNTLVAEALARSPTVLEAQKRLEQAQADLTAQSRSALYPKVDAQLGAVRQKVDPAAFGIPNIPSQPPFSLYNVQVNASYTLDLFGANRRLVEGARAQTQYQAYETEAARLTLAANVVAAAIRQADLQAQLDYTGQMIEAQQQQVAISERRYQAGGIALEDLQADRTQLEQLRATLPPLTAQRQQVDHQLAVYTGRSPAEAAVPRFRLQDLQLPADVPLTLPSELVRRRPDVRASEALWHQAGANVGVATANLFPHLTISGMVGSDRTKVSEIVDGTNVWNIGANLMQPILHAGELRARRRSASAAYEASAQAYEQTVLVSLQQVADSLRALEADGLALQARGRASDESTARYAIAQQRYEAGGISELSLLDAQRQQLQTSLDRNHAEAQRYADTAALLHALGGPPSGGP
jgi:NodT family efflux transporter outer membrane factor (OMF) lipoprotein